MLHIQERVNDTVSPEGVLVLPYELRQRSRLRARLVDGRDVALILPRGSVLRDGDILRSVCGVSVTVRAANESVSSAYTNDTHLLARACYHLGNRHVQVEIGQGWVRYLHDYVLDEMLERLGLEVKQESAPFEPEGGAYSQGHAH